MYTYDLLENGCYYLVKEKEDSPIMLIKAMVDGMLAIFPEASTRDLVDAHICDSWADKS